MCLALCPNMSSYLTSSGGGGAIAACDANFDDSLLDLFRSLPSGARLSHTICPAVEARGQESPEIEIFLNEIPRQRGTAKKIKTLQRDSRDVLFHRTTKVEMFQLAVFGKVLENHFLAARRRGEAKRVVREADICLSNLFEARFISTLSGCTSARHRVKRGTGGGGEPIQRVSLRSIRNVEYKLQRGKINKTKCRQRGKRWHGFRYSSSLRRISN